MNDNIVEYVKKIRAEGIIVSAKNNELDVKAPKGKMTSEIMEELTKRKPEILNYLTGISIDKSIIISVKNLTGNYPISNAQKRLWMLSQLEESSVAYNMPGSIILDREIDIDCFKRAIESTVNRHEILRTVFKENEAGEIRQWILDIKDLGFKIDYKDFSKEKDKKEKIHNYISEDTHTIFNLEKGPLLRASLLQVEDKSYVFYYNMHHIISDGWSMEILSKDVVSNYESYKEKKESQLQPLRIQYKDYSVWQLAQLEEESFKNHRNFWMESLKGKLPVLDLPTTKPRTKIKTYNGYGLNAYIGPVTINKLRTYSNKNGGSLFMGLLAAWNVLMYRYTSQTDIITGTPVAGRDHTDLQDQIGVYINTLALRNEIDPEENFNSFYKKVKSNTLKSYSHQMYPFDRLLEELDVKHDISRSFVFDVLLALQNIGEKTQNSELKKEKLDSITDQGYCTSTFDIRLNFQEVNDYLLLDLVYNPDVYEKEMVMSLINHYKQLLDALLENQEEKISQIDYLSEKEKHELLFTFNDTKTDYPKHKTIVELFEEQVAKTPASKVLVFGEKELTYRELHEKSNQLAYHLKENYNIAKGDPVGIQLHMSDWLIISILAILKIGSTYVPIDPEYPSPRKEYIIKDAGVKLLITETGFIFDVDYHEGDILAVDVELETLKDVSVPLKEIPGPGDLAYLIYTSGSTGEPKGVMIEHKALTNLCFWHKNKFSITEKDRASMYAGMAFDASVWELFPYLISGACLHIVPKKIRLDSAELNTYFEKNKITIAFLPTPVAMQFMEVENSSLRYLLTGGEKLNLFKKKNYTLINNYGPTESTVVATSIEIENMHSNIPIGKPISNIQIYVVDESGQLRPKGVTGEICVGGAGLARGYLNRAELTKQKFIANPFKEGERLYKTGDLGKWLPDGTLAFIGRTDDQTKIRGYRIEPSEIEQTLLRHEQVKEAVVLALENNSNEKELVAYFTARTKQNQADLKEYLKAFLPEYMVPAVYVQLDQLPLTANGKVDKKSLPGIEDIGLTRGIEYIAPRNEIEEKLVKIWEEILKHENIGIKDDFFALGGHSLKIIKVMNQVNKQFGLKYDLKGVYTEPTIEAMARKIKTDLWFLESKNENDYNEVKI